MLELRLQMFLPLCHVAKVHHIKQTYSMRQLTYLKTICIPSLSPTERKHAGNRNCLVYHNINSCNLTNKWTLMKEKISLISKGYIFIWSNRNEVWRIDELVTEFLSVDLSVPNIKQMKKRNICNWNDLQIRKMSGRYWDLRLAFSIFYWKAWCHYWICHTN